MPEVDLTAEHEAFRARVRAWLQSRPELSDEASDGTGRTAEELDEDALERGRKFQRDLYDAGFAGISWPVDGSGRGLDPSFETIFRQEVIGYELPTYMFNVGLGMCGPTVATHGTPAQRRRFLPPLLSGDELWCQLFSEPGAGSDLASVSARAQRDGDEWMLNGQKVWTSGARFADWGLALMRTDPLKPKHSGLTMFIVDMKAPGVDSRPLRQMTGHAKFDEVFLDDVTVPDEQRIGAVNEGWTCARTTLMSERGAVGRNTAQRGGSFAVLAAAASARGLTADPVVRQQLIAVYTAEQITTWIAARSRDAARADRPGPSGAVSKLLATDLIRKASRLGADLAGPAGMAWAPDPEGDDQWALRLCAAPGLSIGGGTDEIIKNSVAENLLGLPREPATDRNLPFIDLVRTI